MHQLGRYILLVLAASPLLAAAAIAFYPFGAIRLREAAQSTVAAPPAIAAPAVATHPAATQSPNAAAQTHAPQTNGISPQTVSNSNPHPAAAQSATIANVREPFPVRRFLEGTSWKSANAGEFDGMLISSKGSEVVVVKFEDLTLHHLPRRTLNADQLKLVSLLESEIDYLMEPIDKNGKVENIDYRQVSGVRPSEGAPVCTVTYWLKNGNPGNGKIQSHAANGLLYRAFENFDGKQQGLQVTFYPDQQPCYFHFWDHKTCFLTLHFYPDGGLIGLTPSPNGVPHGTTSGYYRDGAIALIGEQENGVPHGKVLTYAPNGEVYEVSHAKQGVFVSEKLMRNNPQERAAIQLRLKETSTEEFVRIWNGSLHK